MTFIHFYVVIRERLRKNNSFVLNGIDGHSLIFIPNNFKNVACHVSDEQPLKIATTQCQIFVSEQTLDFIEDFFQLNNIHKKVSIYYKLFILNQ